MPIVHIRQTLPAKRSEAALDVLRQAAVLDSTQARYAYVYAIGLNSAAAPTKLLAVVKESLRGDPNNLDLLSAAVTLCRQKGDVAAALPYAERMARPRPEDPRLTSLIKELKR
jgi:Flp pilus assembly protein TadD